MQWLHLADTHLDKNLRLEDFTKSLDQIAEYAVREQVRFILIAGDIFNRSFPDVLAKKVFKEFVHKLISKNIFVFILKGTHDTSSTNLHSLFDINVYGLENIIVMDKPRIHGIKGGDGKDIKILAVPDISKYSVPNRQEYIIEQISELKKSLTKDTYNICTGHFTVTGAKNASNYDISNFDETVVPLELLRDPIFDYVALGHIHQQQVLSEDPPVIYSGAIERINFGERNTQPGFVYVKDNTYKLISLDVRPMQQFELRNEQELPAIEEGALVKVEIITDKFEAKNHSVSELEQKIIDLGAKEAKVVIKIEKKDQVDQELPEEWDIKSVLFDWVKGKYGEEDIDIIDKEFEEVANGT